MIGEAALRIAEVLVPIALVAGVGFVVARTGAGGRPTLQRLAIYVFGPPFIVHTLATADARLVDLGRTLVFALGMYGGLAVVGVVVAVALRFRRDAAIASVLALAATNCGNYGLPLVLYGFGPAALPIGVAFVAAHTTVHMILGVPAAAVASSGRRGRLRMGPAIPFIAAVLVGALVRAYDVSLPTLVERPLELLGQAWIPTLLLILGMELGEVDLRGVAWRGVVLAAAKLTLAPLLALGLLVALRFDGLWFKALLVQSSTPTAVNSLLFAREFGARPDLVAGVLALSTLGSVVTVSLLLALL